jgi:hypothetical protein
MEGFLKTLQAEMDEGNEIMAFLIFREWVKGGKSPTTEQLMALCDRVGVAGKRASDLIALMASMLTPTIALAAEVHYDDPDALFKQNIAENIDRQALVMIADWLGDMNVYNRSEALKYGIPLEEVLHCIMGSNFTKLNPDGSVTKDANGKVQKGPNFRPPEEHISATLFGRDALQDEYIDLYERLQRLSVLTAPTLLPPMEQLSRDQANENMVRSSISSLSANDHEHGHEHESMIPDDDVEVPEHYDSIVPKNVFGNR